MKKVASGLTLLIALIAFNGCGGDGGGSSSVNGSGGSSASLTFPTNATVAPATADSGEKVANNVAGSNTSTSFINSITSDGNMNLASQSASIVRVANKHLKNHFTPYALNEAINETESCSDGGTMNFNGTTSGTNDTVTITYSQCKEDGTTLNGAIKFVGVTTDAESETYVSESISFLSDFTITGDEREWGMIKAGSSIAVTSMVYDSNDDLGSCTVTITMQGKLDNELFGSENTVWKMTFGSSDLSMYLTSGKEYINNLANYATYDTSYDMSAAPFVFNNYGDLTSGTARFLLGGSGKATIQVTETNKVRVDIDSDGDGSVNETRTVTVGD